MAEDAFIKEIKSKLENCVDVKVYEPDWTIDISEDLVEMFLSRPASEFLIGNNTLIYNGTVIADMRNLDDKNLELEIRQKLGDQSAIMGWTTEKEVYEDNQAKNRSKEK